MADQVILINDQAVQPGQPIDELLPDQSGAHQGVALELGVLRDVAPCDNMLHPVLQDSSARLPEMKGDSATPEESMDVAVEINYAYHLVECEMRATDLHVGLHIVIDDEGRSRIEGIEPESAAARCGELQV